jgi:hypothetical protein
VTEPENLDELARNIRNQIRDNRKFLERVMEEDFETEECDAECEESGEEFEEL